MPQPNRFFRYRIGYGTLQPCLGCQRAALLRGILRGKIPHVLASRRQSEPWFYNVFAYTNDALNIQQLRASGGQTREPILMKFGTQQQIKCSITVTWSNIINLKIQNGGRGRHVGKCWCYNTPTDGPTGTKLGGGISNQRLYRKTFSSVLVVTANRTVNVLILWGEG